MKFINPKEDFEKSISNPRPMEVLKHPENVYVTRTEWCCVSFGEDSSGGAVIRRVLVWHKWKMLPIVFFVMKAEFLQPFILSDVLTALEPLSENASRNQILKAIGRVVRAYGGSRPVDSIDVVTDIMRKTKKDLTKEDRNLTWYFKCLLEGDQYNNCEICFVSPQTAAQRYKRGRKLRKCDRIPTSV